MSQKFAVILSGCGFLDGAEIRESVLTLLALDSEGIQYEIFSIDEDQHHVINHLKAEESNQGRNVLEESARIARGEIKKLSELKTNDFNALVFPGGYGVAKNLCEFAFKGSAGSVNQEVKDTITAFNSAEKPIGGICIAPALLALVLGDKNINVTIGNHQETAAEIEKTGATHTNKEVHEICIDEKNKVVTTAAYMYDDAKLDKVYQGIHSCIKELSKMA